jgi:alkylmercury lyase-like protein
MLAFRSEAHVDRWCEERGRERGAVFPLETCWQLAQAWYADRLAPGWRRRKPAEAEAVFAELGLSGDFWRLAASG